MFKFFSKKRQGLMEGSKVVKYLKYAAGEIVLVVVGILIALQLNIKNEERKSRFLEKKLVEGLINDLKSDSVFYNSRTLLFESQIEFYTNLLDLCSRPDTLPSDTLRLEQQNLGFTQAANYSDVVNNYTDLMGNISDNNIKQALRDYYKSFHFVSKAIELSNNKVETIGMELHTLFGKGNDLNRPIRLRTYRRFCALGNLEGKMFILMNSNNNAKDQTFRFLTDNEKLKLKLLKYLQELE